uniref:Tumor necrosis factor, alpha-induced protein 2a n=1 Tax=Astyanax mexicanus TaxID=7994 RepID=A0A8B9KRN7_ASTMX
MITENTVETLSDSEAKSSKCGFKTQITRLIKNSKDSGGPDILPEVPVLLDFKQNLELNRLAEASQQLLAREEQLFSSESADEQVVCSEEEEERLKNDYETLELRLWMAIKNSFNKRNEATLKSAVAAIVQEEERDRLWEEVAKKEHPIWRPMKCREWHDILLQKVVDKRMQLADREKNVSDNLSEMSVLIQNDLFYVVKDLQGFYPPEFEICHMYAQLYHQVFTKHLRKLPRLNIPIQDCMFILGQISNYSKTLLFNVLKLEEQNWQITDRSHLTDGYYCTLALDTIHVRICICLYTCVQELLGQLHFEVMIKYVGRMLKRKLKLTNKEDQEKAADLLCQDSSRINTLFIENGSDRTWLCEILPKVSEVLKVQDPDALELEVYTLLKEYPDITSYWFVNYRWQNLQNQFYTGFHDVASNNFNNSTFPRKTNSVKLKPHNSQIQCLKDLNVYSRALSGPAG